MRRLFYSKNDTQRGISRVAGSRYDVVPLRQGCNAVRGYGAPDYGNKSAAFRNEVLRGTALPSARGPAKDVKLQLSCVEFCVTDAAR